MRNINIYYVKKKPFVFWFIFVSVFCFVFFLFNPSGLPMSREGFARAPAAQGLAVPPHL